MHPYTDLAIDGAGVVDDDLYPLGLRFLRLEEVSEGTKVPRSIHDRIVCLSVPWLELAKKGNKSVCRFLGKLHGIPMLTRILRHDALLELKDHVCVGCKRFYAIFEPVKQRPRISRPLVSLDACSGAGVDADARVAPLSHDFPPQLDSDQMAIDILREFCTDVKPE